ASAARLEPPRRPNYHHGDAQFGYCHRNGPRGSAGGRADRKGSSGHLRFLIFELKVDKAARVSLTINQDCTLLCLHASTSTANCTTRRTPRSVSTITACSTATGSSKGFGF